MSWKDTLSAIAPTLATALGGPLAGAATKFLAGNLLGDDAPTDDKSILKNIEQAVLGASPEQLVEIKNLDHEFKVEMKKLDIDVFKITADDKKNARQEHKQSIMPAVLSCTLSFIVALIVYMLFYIEPPKGAREVLFMLLGVVVKEWGGSMQYWFGTTRSSSDKNKFIK